MSTGPPPFLDLTATFGAMYIGAFISTGLWGITTMQAFMYYIEYGVSDGLGLKSLVATLWLLDTAHKICIIRGVWIYLIPRFGDYAVLGGLYVENFLQVIFTGFIGVFAQFFFIWRMFVFSKRQWLIPILLVPPSIAVLVIDILYTVLALRNDTVAYLGAPHMQRLDRAANSTTAVLDVLIAAIMCGLLLAGRTGWAHSNRIITKLITFSVNTGLWTAILALGAVITSVTRPGELWYSLFYQPISAVYVNSVLANLNARQYIKGSHGEHRSGTQSYGLNPMSGSQGYSGHGTERTLTESRGVVLVEQAKLSDMDDDIPVSKIPSFKRI